MTYDDEYTKALADVIMAAEPHKSEGNGHGGVRTGATGRPPGIPNPNGGRKTRSPNGHTVARNVTLDPDIFQRVVWHAEKHTHSFSASVNMLLRRALKDAEFYDEDAEYVVHSAGQ